MIEVKDIVKTFNENTRKANTVLDHASITFPDHGFVFIVGKSGIGKSTILNSIGGLISYNGEILYDGKKENIEEYRRQNIGYIFQDFLLFDDLSVRENIKIGLNIAGVYDEKEITKRVNVLLKAVGLNINARRSAKALSLGQRQRVAIARALASNPKIILADEPTGNLDSKNSLNVMQILKNLSKDHLIICVTHNVNLVHLFADYAFAIKDKKFVQIDPKKENLDDIYVQNRINIASLSKKELKEDNISFKIYSDDSTVESKLTIINRGGKITIIGDNVSLASKDDISLVNTIESEEKDEVSKVEIVDEEPIDLNFESKKEKPKFKDSVLYKTLNEMLSFENLKYKKKKKFFRIAAMIIPLIIYLLLDVCFGVISGLESVIAPEIKYQSDNVLVAVSKNNKGFTLSQEILSDLITDEESHLIETNNQLSVYSVNNRFINTYRTYNNYYNDDYYDSYDANRTSAIDIKTTNKIVSEGLFKLKTSYFTVFDKILSLDNKVTFNPTVTFSNIDNYRNVCSELKNINLNDDELIIDKGIFLTFNSNNTYKFPNGDIYSNIIDTYLNMPYYDGSNVSKSFKLKIVDVKDSGFATVFCNKNTYQKLQMTNLVNDVSSLSYVNKSIENYEVVNFDDFDETKYSFYKDENDVKTEISKSELFDYWNNDDNQLIKLTRSDLSSSSLKSVGFASKSVLNECRIYRNNDTDTIYCNGSFIAPSNIYVENKAEPNKKVVVLQDCLDPESKTISSYNNFIKNKIITSLIHNSSLDEKLSGNTVSIPKKYEGAIKEKKNLVDAFDLGQEYSFNDSENKFYYSNDFFKKALSTTYSEATISAPTYFYNSKEVISFSSPFAYFVSDDVDKTIKYMNDNSDKYDFTLERYSELKTYVVAKNTSKVMVPFIIVILILVGAMVLILVLQSVSKVNKMKYEFGVLRCLGKPINQIILDYLVNSLIDYTLSCFIPSILLTFVLIGLGLYYIGYFFIVYLLLMFAVTILSDLIPLIITIVKKPYQILKNLN